MIELAPSILSADFARLGAEALAALEGGSTVLHGPPVVASLRKFSRVPLDCHLMIERPDEFIPAFAEAGADWISVHHEACVYLDRTLHLIAAQDEVRSGHKPGNAGCRHRRGPVFNSSCSCNESESGIWGPILHSFFPEKN